MKKIVYTYTLLLFCMPIFGKQIFNFDTKFRCGTINKYTIESVKNDTNYIKFSIKNTQNFEDRLLIEIEKNEYDNFIIYQAIHNKIISKISNTNANYYDRNYVFEFVLKSNMVYDFTIISKSKLNENFHFLLWKKDAKMSRNQALELTRGVFYGVVFLFIFIITLLAVLLKQKQYFYYAIFLFLGTAYLFIKTGLANEYFWHQHPEIDTFFRKIMLSTYIVSSIIFLRDFLLEDIQFSKLRKAIKYFIFFGFVLIFISLSIGILNENAKNIFIHVQNIFTVVATFIIGYILVISYFRNKEKPMILFIVAYFLSFIYFLYNPFSELGNSFGGVSTGQIYIYSNVFIITILISFTAIFRVMYILRNNKKLKREVSIIHANKNFALIEGQLNERKRVGQELHDGIGIMMSTIKMRLSSIKTINDLDKIKLQQLIKQVDASCNSIRNLSHDLLPPTLQKFGLNIALKDLTDKYKNEYKININFNANIPNNISNVSKTIVYELTKNLLIMVCENKAEIINLSIYILPSIFEAQIKISYHGNMIAQNNIKLEKNIKYIDFLHGKYNSTLVDILNHQIIVEIPILLK